LRQLAPMTACIRCLGGDHGSTAIALK
jgi:hypothetical protein